MARPPQPPSIARKQPPGLSERDSEHFLSMYGRFWKAVANRDLPEAEKIQKKIAKVMAILGIAVPTTSPSAIGDEAHEEAIQKSEYVPIAEALVVRQPSKSLETKTSKLKELLEECAELAGDDKFLLDFALAQPFFKQAAGPPKLFEPKQSAAAEVGENPGARVKAAYGPPEGTLLRLDHLARMNYSLYKQYNAWAGRNARGEVERIITKTDYLALVARRLNGLGYSDEILKSIGVSLEKQKARPKAGQPANAYGVNEKWSERNRDNSESPADFTIRIYGQWLDEGFSRQHLRSLDRPLYDALAKWFERNEIPKKLKKFYSTSAVRRSPRVDEELAELGIKKPNDAFEKLPDDQKRAERLYQAALRRQLHQS